MVNSSTSNSKNINTYRLPLLVLFFTGLLVMFLSITTSWLPISAKYGETSLQSGLLRIQKLNESKGKSAILVGTSITAKLFEDIAFRGVNLHAVNFGLDGGSSYFGVDTILKSGREIKLVIIEANLIYKLFNKNTEILAEQAQSFYFNLSEKVSILKPQYRPSTLLYSSLKDFKDSRSSSNLSKGLLSADPITMYVSSVQIGSSLTEKGGKGIEAKWIEKISVLKQKGIIVVFAMIPDCEHNRINEYKLMKYLSFKTNAPIIDLKQALKDLPLKCTDGIHLNKSSAQFVSKAINSSLLASPFIKTTGRPSVATLH